MFKENININQTHIRLTTDTKNNNLKPLIHRIHKDLNSFINLNKEFLLSIDSLSYNSNNLPEIIQLMIESSKKAQVGPMACVAGSISEICLNHLIKLNSKHTIIENGGDIAIINNKTVLCGIYSNNTTIGNKIAFKIKPQKTPIGICTSSGKIGHSISFGNSDSVTVISNSSSTADGLATKIANEVKGKNSNEAISNGLEISENYREFFKGVLIICEDNIGTIGRLPKIVETEEFELDEI